MPLPQTSAKSQQNSSPTFAARVVKLVGWQGRLMSRLGSGSTLPWRTLLSVVVAYAVAVQSLFIAVAGFSLPADAAQNAPAVELCLHDTSGAPQAPAANPDHSGCTHCIFCFAGAHHAVIGAAPAAFNRVYAAVVAVPWLGGTPGSTRPTRYTIASPRGPPLGA
jgi:hypothetical protein